MPHILFCFLACTLLIFVSCQQPAATSDTKQAKQQPETLQIQPWAMEAKAILAAIEKQLPIFEAAFKPLSETDYTEETKLDWLMVGGNPPYANYSRGFQHIKYSNERNVLHRYLIDLWALTLLPPVRGKDLFPSKDKKWLTDDLQANLDHYKQFIEAHQDQPPNAWIKTNLKKTILSTSGQYGRHAIFIVRHHFPKSLINETAPKASLHYGTFLYESTAEKRMTQHELMMKWYIQYENKIGYDTKRGLFIK